MRLHRPAPTPKAWLLPVVTAVLASTIGWLPLPSSAQTSYPVREAAARTRPLEVVKSSFSRVAAAEGAERRVEIRRVTAELFDFPEMARRVLGEHWQDGTAQEQAEFVQLFAEMLDRAYLSNLGNMPLSTVVFDGELISGPYARVSSRMPNRRGDTAIEYRLKENEGRWRVYDVAVDGVGLVSSYRTQFNSVLRNASFTDLMDRLRNRDAKTEQGP